MERIISCDVCGYNEAHNPAIVAAANLCGAVYDSTIEAYRVENTGCQRLVDALNALVPPPRQTQRRTRRYTTERDDGGTGGGGMGF